MNPLSSLRIFTADNGSEWEQNTPLLPGMAFQTLLVLLLENTASSQCPQGLAREAQTDVVEQRRNGEGRKEKEGREARRRKGRQEGKMKEKKKKRERKKEIAANSQQHTSAGM